MTQRKDGTWQQALTCIVDGRKVQRYFYGKTKADVLRKIQAYEEEQALGPTFREVAEEWWQQHETQIAVNTRKSYVPALKRAKEHFGDIRIRQVTPPDVNQFIMAFIQEKNAAKKTAATQLMIINLICKYAVARGYLVSNPARDVSLPRKLRKGRRSMPTAADIARVKLSSCEPFGMFAYWILYSGCRRGELLALTWDDVDIKGGWIHITKSLYYDGGKPALKLPKTDAGERNIPLMTKLSEQLTPGEGIIFTNESGGYLTEYQFQRRWAQYAAVSGVSCTPHQIRHAYATMLYENGVSPKDAQTLLGHAQLSTTMDIYTHIRDERSEKIKSALINLDIDG